MNVTLWMLQIFLGIYFIAVGVEHFIVPPDLPDLFAWFYDLPPWLHYVSGAANILGGLGLILPGVLRIQTRLVPLAAGGLMLVMVGAVIFHATRGETLSIVMNLINIVLLAFVAYGRWKLVPFKNRTVGDPLGG